MEQKLYLVRYNTKMKPAYNPKGVIEERWVKIFAELPHLADKRVQKYYETNEIVDYHSNISVVLAKEET